MKVQVAPTSWSERVRTHFDRFIALVELAALVLIGLATAFAISQEAWKMVESSHVSLTDLLLMFLYQQCTEGYGSRWKGKKSMFGFQRPNLLS
jgi:protein PsiE